MQQVELNTITQLLQTSCRKTYSKHFLSYQIIYIKQHLVLPLNAFQRMTDLNQITKTWGPGCRYLEKARKSRLLVVVKLNDINNAKPTVYKPALQIKK